MRSCYTLSKGPGTDIDDQGSPVLSITIKDYIWTCKNCNRKSHRNVRISP